MFLRTATVEKERLLHYKVNRKEHETEAHVMNWMDRSDCMKEGRNEGKIYFSHFRRKFSFVALVWLLSVSPRVYNRIYIWYQGVVESRQPVILFSFPTSFKCVSLLSFLLLLSNHPVYNVQYRYTYISLELRLRLYAYNGRKGKVKNSKELNGE